MPLGGANINWNEASPADSDLVGQGDDEMRSIRTAIRSALDSEHNFPSTGGAGTGWHRQGSARPYYGPGSIVSSDGTNSRLFFQNDAPHGPQAMALWGLNAIVPSLLGHDSIAINASTNSGFGSIHKFATAIQLSFGTVGSSGSTLAPFGSAFSGRPACFATPVYTGLANSVTIAVGRPTASAVSVWIWDETGAPVTENGFFLASIGTVSLGVA